MPARTPLPRAASDRRNSVQQTKRFPASSLTASKSCLRGLARGFFVLFILTAFVMRTAHRVVFDLELLTLIIYRWKMFLMKNLDCIFKVHQVT